MTIATAVQRKGWGMSVRETCFGRGNIRPDHVERAFTIKMGPSHAVFNKHERPAHRTGLRQNMQRDAYLQVSICFSAAEMPCSE